MLFKVFMSELVHVWTLYHKEFKLDKLCDRIELTKGSSIITLFFEQSVQPGPPPLGKGCYSCI